MEGKKERKKRRTVVLTEKQQQKAELEVAKRKISNPDAYDLPPSKRTVQDLEQFFIRAEEGTKHILPKEKRRYVIYLRKSTDDESKQVRSLEDQRTECLELARHLNITVRDQDIFEESASAKKSGNRPIFDDIVMGFKTGKYHGLLAWSPDRLSRNMKEAGEIIEMIDMEEIQDLHFKTYQFENSPNGKMLLGILFATSKQYSDKLSVDVKRGTDGNIKEGKYNGVVKKGYFVDAGTGYFLPDGYSWDLLREAVNMRLYQGKTNVEVADFLNDSHLSVRKDQDSDYMIAKMTKARVGELFEDPFYFGLYQYGDKVTNLIEMTGFLPLITPDEYVQLNKKVASSFGTAYAGQSVQNKKLEYGLLRGKVICDYCDVPMQFQHQRVQRGKNKGKYVISFYCRNSDNCIRHNEAEAIKQFGHKLSKSIRAKYVMAHIEWTLRHLTKKSKKAYQLYIDKLQLRLAQDTAIAKRKLSEAKSDLRINEQKYLKYQDFQVTNPVDYKKHHKGKLEHYESLMKVANHNIKTAETELKRLSVGLPTEKQFYELVRSYLLQLLQTTDLMEQDAICNELVSNLRAGDDSVSVIKLNPPYNMLVDLAKVPTGRG
jgi:DNA invertase Pin-like site-specific DNA recombinase